MDTVTDLDLKKTLKLLAKDLEDLHIMAAHLQDSLMPVTSMVFEPKERRFRVLANRFCWEHPVIEHEGAPLYHRIHTGLSFQNVDAVHHKGFARQGEKRLLNFLTMHGQNEGAIHLIFSKGHEICLKTSELHVMFGDLKEPWPTRLKPTHIHEHIEAMAKTL